jgi:cell division protein FtsA
MDTRVGYPNEHLANNTRIENLTSPMFATGIGLVMKGFETIERNQKGVKEEAASAGSVKTHSKKGHGSFFEKIIEKSKELFSDED